MPFSSVDWPGKLVAVVFLQGCPWRCPYCHNAGILDPRAQGPVAWQTVLDLMDSRRGLLDGVVFSGGEALMQASSGALGSAMQQVRERGFLVGLHAGGAYPTQLGMLLERGLLDWVGLDIKALPRDYPLATGRFGGAAKAEASLRMLAEHPAVDHEVRLTLWPGLLAAMRPDRNPGQGGLREKVADRLESGGEEDGIYGTGPGLAAEPSPPADGRAEAPASLVDYAVGVAAWARSLGARHFALQRYRVPATGEGATPEVGWSEDEARAALEPLGFQSLTVR